MNKKKKSKQLKSPLNNLFKKLDKIYLDNIDYESCHIIPCNKSLKEEKQQIRKMYY